MTTSIRKALSSSNLFTKCFYFSAFPHDTWYQVRRGNGLNFIDSNVSNASLQIICSESFHFISPRSHEVSLRIETCPPFRNAMLSTLSNEREEGENHNENETKKIYRSGPLSIYNRFIQEGKLLPGDVNQEETIGLLQNLYDLIIGGRYTQSNRNEGNVWSKWFFKPEIKPSTRGLYLYGGVGSGKTMLMDMFFEELPEWISKSRIHFHDFMLLIHKKLKNYSGSKDPLISVSNEIMSECNVLCLDEFMVSDVADAMILNRLFKYLFSKNLILIATSNRSPDKLYENGLQRELFIPFIHILKDHCIVHEIKSATDYRKLTAIKHGSYFHGHDSHLLFKEKINLFCHECNFFPASISLPMGRRLQILRSYDGIAYFQFEEICETALGASDYFGLCRNFHTIFIEDIPIFVTSNRSAAYRFVTLIDVMYENKTRLFCSAEGSPFELFQKIFTISDAPKRTSSRSKRSDDAEIIVDNELGFVKERTVSRLIEMQSKEYEEIHLLKYSSGLNLQQSF